MLKLSDEELINADLTFEDVGLSDGPVTPENVDRYVDLKIKQVLYEPHKEVYLNFIKGVEFVIRLSYLKLLTPIEIKNATNIKSIHDKIIVPFGL